MINLSIFGAGGGQRIECSIGYGYWPDVVYDPMEISGDLHNQYRKELREKSFWMF
jgi:hypothetical protein